MVHMIVSFYSTASFFSISIILSAVELSKPLVGSSHNNTLGSVINSYPILVLFLSPPDIPFSVTPPMIVSWQPFRPSLAMISLTFTSIYLSFKAVLSLAANLKLSTGENVESKTSSCWTKAPILPKSFCSRFLSLHFTTPFMLDPGLKLSL